MLYVGIVLIILGSLLVASALSGDRDEIEDLKFRQDLLFRRLAAIDRQCDSNTTRLRTQRKGLEELGHRMNEVELQLVEEARTVSAIRAAINSPATPKPLETVDVHPFAPDAFWTKDSQQAA